MKRLLLLTIALFATTSAIAEYTIRIPIAANIVFVQPKSDESICQASARYVEEYAATLNVNISVGTGYTENLCNVDIYNISSFANVEQLTSVGNYVKSLKAENYTMSSVVYGFADGTGQGLLFNGTVYAEMLWSQR